MTIKKAHLGLINPKSPTNMGFILRAAGCYQVTAIAYTGTRHDRAAQFGTDTKRVAQIIPLTAVESILDVKPKGAKIICIELVEGAIPLPEFKHPDNAFYIFGPEDGSIDQSIINKADAVVYIPTIGCMNLAATVNVVLYDRLAKSSNIIANDTLVRSSRDTNNNLKV